MKFSIIRALTLAVLLMMLWGCAAPPQAKDGDIVKVHYTGKLEDGSVFDSSVGKEPLQFRIGAHRVIPGFENGATGMVIGEKKTVTIPPDDAYGSTKDELITKVNKSDIPEGITPVEGQRIQVPSPAGGFIMGVVTEISEETITIDKNHPLAGKTLIFELELVEIVEP
jgi:FKBP-type peptidyl-prolyl cis-trans isomerase 2